MTDDEIRALLDRLDQKSADDAERAWESLRPLGDAVVPFLADAYGRFRQATGRVRLVFCCTRYARTSPAAFQLGLLALNDKAALVRYRACGLLAYSLRTDALPHLEAMIHNADTKTVDDARAAMDAIRRQNHHFFVDRDHTGRSFWSLNPGDAPA